MVVEPPLALATCGLHTKTTKRRDERAHASSARTPTRAPRCRRGAGHRATPSRAARRRAACACCTHSAAAHARALRRCSSRRARLVDGRDDAAAAAAGRARLRDRANLQASGERRIKAQRKQRRRPRSQQQRKLVESPAEESVRGRSQQRGAQCGRAAGRVAAHAPVGSPRRCR